MDKLRDVSGNPAAMLALAHPTRLAVLELLAEHGPLTASEAGRLLDESPGSMSWHLRMLARHGFVAEAEATGRRRPWQLTAGGTRFDPEPSTDVERSAADTLTRTAVERAFGQLSAWLAGRHTAPSNWQRAAAVSDWTLYLTADETGQLREEMYRLLERYSDRLAEPRLRPVGAVPVRGFIALHPQRPRVIDTP